MQNDKHTADIAAFLHQLADWIESHPSSFESFAAPVPKPRGTATPHTDTPDVAKIHAESGVDGLKQFLASCDHKTLRRIISNNGFDPSRLSRKWKDRDRLVTLIVDRAVARSQKGDAF